MLEQKSVTFFSLPQELITKIYRELSLEDLIKMAGACKGVNAFSLRDERWKLEVEKISPLLFKDKESNFFEKYSYRYIYVLIKYYLNKDQTRLVKRGKENELHAELILKIPTLAKKVPSINLLEMGKLYLNAAVVILKSRALLEEISTLPRLVYMCKHHQETAFWLLENPEYRNELMKNRKYLTDLGSVHPEINEYILNNFLLKSDADNENLIPRRMNNF